MARLTGVARRGSCRTQWLLRVERVSPWSVLLAPRYGVQPNGAAALHSVPDVRQMTNIFSVPDECEVKSEYVSESHAMEGKFGGCGAAAPRNFF